MTTHAEPGAQTEKTKISVSLPTEVVDRARRAVREGRASSVSTYLADAEQRSERERSLQWLVDELIALHGPPDPQDQARVDEALGLR